jgi:CubicO group peptidase (beta-lactamase class C family)
MVMRSGLAWVEAPEEGERSDVVTMLYGNHRRAVPDTAAWAADRPLADPPGSRFLYSSGTSAVVSGIVRDLVGPGPDYERWLRQRLFDPLGMASATPKFDEAGTWMASSFCFCTARDFARFGELYLGGGEWQGSRLLSEGWVATAAEETGRDDDGRIHSSHWWVFGDNPWGAYFCSGYLGQYVVVVPPLDLVVVRLGETPPTERGQVAAVLGELISSFEG